MLKSEDDLQWIRQGSTKLGFDRKIWMRQLIVLEDSNRYIDLSASLARKKSAKFGVLDFKYDPKDKWTAIEDVLENLDRLVKAGKSGRRTF